MTPTEYVELAMRTSAKHDTAELRFENACLGLIGELGEVAEHYKKAKFHGKPLDPVKVLEEIGDIYWYIAQAVDAAGLDAEGVFDATDLSEWFPARDEVSYLLANASLHIGFFVSEEWRVPEGKKYHLSVAASFINRVVARLNSTQEAVMEANIAKLKARWPDGFKTQ